MNCEHCGRLDEMSHELTEAELAAGDLETEALKQSGELQRREHEKALRAEIEQRYKTGGE